MITMLQNWKGTVEINGTSYTSINNVKTADFSDSRSIHIVLRPKHKNATQSVVDVKSRAFRVSVRKYMTQKSSPEFDFMAKWNNDNPMPLRTMIGTIEKETRGMVYMKLHGDIYAEKVCTCMMCGRALTNPVSQYFGIGPECGGHNYVNPFDDEEQLKEAVSSYKKQLQNITWEGWVIKSAITEQEELENV